MLFFLSQLYPVKYFDNIFSKYFDKLLILSMIKVESNFKQNAVSAVGAYGLMQVMPVTADWLNEKYSLNYDYKKPEDNIKLGIIYLDYLYELTGSIEESIMFYNTGPNASLEIKVKSGQRYISKVKKTYFIYKFLYWSD